MSSRQKPNTKPCHRDRKLKAVDLFCGCGGLTVGLKAAGFQVIGAVDVDPLSTATYKANHKNVETWTVDIRKLRPIDMLRKLGIDKGELDLLAGCPPCQGFSTMRTLNGSVRVHDPRNQLLIDFKRFVIGIRPKAVMMENVPGLAKDKGFRDFCNTMRKFGYHEEYRVLDAANYGVPQRRKRLIYLAGKGRKIPLGKPSQKAVTVRDAIGNLPDAGTSGDPVHDMPEMRSEKVLGIIRLVPKNGGSRSDLPKELHLDCHKRCDGFKDVYGRMAWDQISPTITSGCFNPSKGRFLHPEEDRAITMREAALLQGFPPRYKFPTTNNKSAIALMIGNALPPPFITAHAKAIATMLHNAQLHF